VMSVAKKGGCGLRGGGGDFRPEKICTFGEGGRRLNSLGRIVKLKKIVSLV